jgi:hypothetical protein
LLALALLVWASRSLPAGANSSFYPLITRV